MSAFQICLCGAQPGYLHSPYCPRPLYQCSDAEAEQWQREHDQNAALAVGYMNSTATGQTEKVTLKRLK